MSTAAKPLKAFEIRYFPEYCPPGRDPNEVLVTVYSNDPFAACSMAAAQINEDAGSWLVEAKHLFYKMVKTGEEDIA